MKTKLLLGAITVAVLAVMGIVGLQQVRDSEAGNFAGWLAPNPSTVGVGGGSTIVGNYLQQAGTGPLIITLSSPNGAAGVITTASASGCPGTAFTGLGTAVVTFTDSTAGCAATGTFTLGITCTNAGPGPGNGVINITLTFGGAGGTVLNGVGSTTQTLQCTGVALGAGASTIAVRKVDQYGQPSYGAFSIQAGPFWQEVARIVLGPAPFVSNCDTAGNTVTATGGTAACPTGTVTPAPFTTGLPAGTYRIVEVGGGTTGPNNYCTLVGVYNGHDFTTGGTGATNNLFWGSPVVQPYTITIPDANPLDLMVTFVNSCIPPGAASTATSSIAVVIGGSTPGLVNTSNVEISPAPGSDDDARVDIRVRDSNSIPIPNAHVTVLIDKGALALRRDISSFPNSGYDVLEPAPAVYFGSNISGDTCDQSTNGWWQQSTANGNYTWPFLTTSRQQADGFTNLDGLLSACVYVDPVLAPGVTPGKINVQAIVETLNQGGLYYPGVSPSYPTNPVYPLGTNLVYPNYLAAPNIVLTATITVVGPPASITVAAAPTSLNCGEKATITVTVKDSAGQNVSDRTRVELVTNFGGVLGGTTATLGPVSVAGGQVYPVSSTSAETFNGVATAYLLTSTDHVGPYEVVAAAGGSVTATNGNLAPWYPGLYPTFNNVAVNALGTPVVAGTPFAGSYYPYYNQGLLSYTPSSAPVNAQATVTCSVPGAPAAAAPVVTAPRTGQGPADAFAIRPPNTGDAGLATSSSSSSWTLVAGALMVLTISGVAVATVVRR